MTQHKVSLLAGVLVLLCGAVAVAADAPALETEHDKALYALGVGLSDQIAAFDLSPEEVGLVQAGLADGLNRSPRLQPQGYSAQLNELYDSRRVRVQERNQKEGRAFLENFSKQAGVTVTESGLAYLEIEPGTGAGPTAQATVIVHYVGTFIDGRVFDSSVEAGEPAEFPLDAVVTCFSEGLQTMRVGGKRKLVCPSDLAYGDNGSPPLIPPGSTLIFDVELLDLLGGAADETTP